MRYLIIFLIVFFCIPAAQAKVYKDIPYVKGTTNPKQMLDIYVPDNAEIRAMPVVVYVHGGAWVVGDKANISKKDFDMVGDFNKNGVILVSVNYRLSPAVTHPSHVEDIAAAVKWITDNIARYGGDRKNMVLTGHSAGAHLVALLGTDGRYLAKHGLNTSVFKAVIPVDSASFDLTKDSDGGALVARAKNKAFGTSEEVLKNASPFYQIGTANGKAPITVFVTQMRPTAVRGSQEFVTALKKAGYGAQLFIVKGGLNHAEMNQQIFTASGDTHGYILNLLRVR